MTTARPGAIGVLGAGAWGTALAILAARNGHPVWLWGHDGAHVQALARARCNVRHLPEAPFPEGLELEADLSRLAGRVRQILVAVPSRAFRATLQQLRGTPEWRAGPPADAIVAWATKGIEPGTTHLLHDVVREVMGDAVPMGVITGPTFAGEVARGLPTVLCVGAERRQVADKIARWLHNGRVHAYTNTDIAGVQLGAAIKNVIAIAVGISDGLGFGANARAALITRGLRELAALGVALGGRPETFMGLAATGDLILTCTDDQSRNRRLGIGLGAGRTLAEMVAELEHEPEGVRTARELHELSLRHEVAMPITERVYRVLYENVAPKEVVEAMLHHEPQEEELLLTQRRSGTSD